jgi:hypothetical protein
MEDGVMESFKLTLTERDAAAKPVSIGGIPAPVIFGMKFVKLLSDNRSLFRFRIYPSGGPPSQDFYLDSVNASEFFTCFNNVFYGEPTDSTQLETMDSAGNPVATAELTVSISPASPPLTFHDYPTTVNVCTLSLTPSGSLPTTFMVANSDTSAMQWFMDAMLMSNPPSPPR